MLSPKKIRKKFIVILYITDYRPTECSIDFGTVCFSPERTCGNPEDGTDEIFDAAAIVVDLIADCVDMSVSGVILTGL
jgi:hypothetical protein